MPDSIIINSPVGKLYIAASDRGIIRIKFNPDSSYIITNENQNPHLIRIAKQLDEYFKGTRSHFELDLDWSDAPDFHKKVWSALLKIPYGQTVAYSDIAMELDNPKAVRAVGMANGKNPIPIVVPCHRVIGKSGNLHGFTGGLDIKEKLLHIENPQRFPIQQALF